MTHPLIERLSRELNYPEISLDNHDDFVNGRFVVCCHQGEGQHAEQQQDGAQSPCRLSGHVFQ